MLHLATIALFVAFATTGSTPPPHEYSNLVQVQSSPGAYKCGAILLNPMVAITAAECVAKVPRAKLKIRALHNEDSMIGHSSHIKHVIVHDDFREYDSFPKEIALLLLAEGIDINPDTTLTGLNYGGPNTTEDLTLLGWLNDENYDYDLPEISPTKVATSGLETVCRSWSSKDLICVYSIGNLTRHRGMGWFLFCRDETSGDYLCGVEVGSRYNDPLEFTPMSKYSSWIQAKLFQIGAYKKSFSGASKNTTNTTAVRDCEGFKCNISKICIPISHMCDSWYDCGLGDQSDETNCRSDDGCHWSQFACAGGNNCIPSISKCDGIGDCPDYSDEVNCSVSLSIPDCGSAKFQCNLAKTCIPLNKICDGFLDCGMGDKSDEENCREVNGCHRRQFSCHRGNKCISWDLKCDGSRDCSDYSDETNCSARVRTRSCSSMAFECNDSKKCIPKDLVCNGIADCGPNDISDEQDCRQANGCHKTQFACHRGNKCIPEEKRCNAKKDCFDGSDEEHCPNHCLLYGATICSSVRKCYTRENICDGKNDCDGTHSSDEENCAPGLNGCTWNQFACREDQTCIRDKLQCDGNPDCDDGSDEENCGQVCRRCGMLIDCSDKSLSDEEQCLGFDSTRCLWTEFTCRNNSLCIPAYQRCDGRNDCQDSSDEDNCQLKNITYCMPSKLPCKSARRCFSLQDICNGRKDCGDNDYSDEENCMVALNGCQWNQFYCHDDGTCIPSGARCDGLKDCKDGSDESNCGQPNGCHWTQFTCQNDSKCIPANFRCDGIKNCTDGSDEQDCNVRRCHWAEFRCHDNSTCIPGHQHCDGATQCRDESDEENCDARDFGTAVKVIGYVAIPAAIAAVLGMVLVATFRRYSQQQNHLSEMEIRSFEDGEAKKLIPDGFAHENARYMPYDKKHEIKWEHFKVLEEEKLGEGAFGVVFKGHMVADPSSPIAVKTVKTNVEKSVLLALLSELKIMIHLENHANVVQFLGACTEFLGEGRAYVLIEYCPMGSLRSYLQTFSNETMLKGMQSSGNAGVVDVQHLENGNSSVSIDNMMTWAIQIASGMEHLHTKRVIHGDLAARNVLLCSNASVKITDFGLSRQLVNYDIYIKTSRDKLPWRWLALETLKRMEFSTKSDVWSYGITLWEIFSFGLVPYPGTRWTADFVDFLEQNGRLSKPKHAAQEIYDIMLSCWDSDPEVRPDFQHLQELLHSVSTHESH